METLLQRAQLVSRLGPTTNLIARYEHPMLRRKELRGVAAAEGEPREALQKEIRVLPEGSPSFMVTVRNNFDRSASMAKHWEFQLLVGGRAYEGKKVLLSALDDPQPCGCEDGIWINTFVVTFPGAPFDLKGDVTLVGSSVRGAQMRLGWDIAD